LIALPNTAKYVKPAQIPATIWVPMYAATFVTSVSVFVK